MFQRGDVRSGGLSFPGGGRHGIWGLRAGFRRDVSARALEVGGDVLIRLAAARHLYLWIRMGPDLQTRLPWISSRPSRGRVDPRRANPRSSGAIALKAPHDPILGDLRRGKRMSVGDGWSLRSPCSSLKVEPRNACDIRNRGAISNLSCTRIDCGCPRAQSGTAWERRGVVNARRHCPFFWKPLRPRAERNTAARRDHAFGRTVLHRRLDSLRLVVSTPVDWDAKKNGPALCPLSC